MSIREIGQSPEFGKPQDKCAVIGVYSKHISVALSTLNGLIELNHRGQEGAGIVVSNGHDFKLVKDRGLAESVFIDKHGLPKLEGSFVAAGHNRYSTSGSLAESQPFLEGDFSLSHNGNLTNVRHLRSKYRLPEEIDGATSDSRIALAVINKQEEGSEKEKILKALKEFEGAFSFVITTRDTLYAARDSRGFKPLSLGKFSDGGFAVASESVAFPSMGAEFVRDIQPGEVIAINEEGVKTIALDRRSPLSQCIFELVYIARIDSKVFGIPVIDFRLRQGEILSRHLPDDVDVIMSVPRSGIGAAEGLAASQIAKIRGIPYIDGLYTNPYRNIARGPRTFIQPSDRRAAAMSKYSPIESILEGKSVAIVDDSIVRGSVDIPIRRVREGGARKVHVMVASPPIRHDCYFGVDMDGGGLIANQFPDIEGIRKHIGADSLYYLTEKELVEAAVGNPVENVDDLGFFEKAGFCGSCFTGKYPLNVDGVISKH